MRKTGQTVLLKGNFIFNLASPIIDLTFLDCSTGIVSLNLRPATFFTPYCWFKLGSRQLLTKAQEKSMHTISTGESHTPLLHRDAF